MVEKKYKIFKRAKMSLSIGCFVHNLNKNKRGTIRVRNFLYSLRNQVNTVINPKIIIFDWSNDNSFDEIDNYCKEFKAIHIYKKFEGKVWNKSKALNFALKNFSSEYIMGTDIDYIFSPQFLQTVQSYASPKNILLCRVYKIKKEDENIIYNVKDYQKLLSKAVFYKTKKADGASQIVFGNFFLKNKGYHEGFQMWGGMDNEFTQMSRLNGLIEIWIDPYTSILHQFHHPIKSDSSAVDYEFAKNIKKKNIRLLNLKKRDRNKEDWGRIDIDKINNYIEK